MSDVVRLQPTKFTAEVEAAHRNLKAWLIWATPMLASVASILDASFIKGWISSEIPGLFFTVLTAVVGFVLAVTTPKDDREHNQTGLKQPNSTQQK